MDRQVVKSGFEFRGDVKAAVEGDDYQKRLLKLIPAETVAVYLSLDGVLRSALKDERVQLEVWLWGIFAIIGVANLFYLKRIQKVRAWSQYAIMTMAFGLWVLSIGGPFHLYSWYRPFYGSVLTGLFTFIVPLIYTGEDSL
jgi:hypothetical protein